MTRVLTLFVSIFLVSGCSLLGANRQVGIEKQRAGPEIRDVPYEARESKEAPLRKRVMVLPFINPATSRSEDAANAAREAFIRQLRRTDEFVIVANSDFPKDVSGFIKAGQYDLEAMGKVAAAMGISAIIEGRILEV